MRCLFAMVFCILVPNTVAYSQASYEQVLPIAIHVFGIGDGKAECGYFKDPNEPAGPTDLAIDRNGNFIISDYRNRRLIGIDKSFNPIFQYPLDIYADLLQLDGDSILCYRNDSPIEFAVLSMRNGAFSIVANSRELGSAMETSFPRSLFFTNNFIIHEEGKGQYSSFELSTNKNKPIVYRNVEETVMYFQGRFKGHEAFWYNGKGVLFFRDRMLADSSSRIESAFEKPVRFVQKDGSSLNASNGNLDGVDGFLNYYFETYGRVFIFNKDGDLIKAFKIQEGLLTSRLGVDIIGNIFFFHSDEKGHTLYMIRNSWKS